MTTILTKFGKFRYNRLPVRMCTSGVIFKDKVDKLISDIEGIEIYTDDITVLRKDNSPKQIYIR